MTVCRAGQRRSKGRPRITCQAVAVQQRHRRATAADPRVDRRPVRLNVVRRKVVGVRRQHAFRITGSHGVTNLREMSKVLHGHEQRAGLGKAVNCLAGVVLMTLIREIWDDFALVDQWSS